MSINAPIIIIDDDDDDHYILKRVLEKMGVNTPVLFFNESHLFFKYLETSEEKPFLILCDVNMPIMNGLEVKRAINQHAKLKNKHIPFIFFSTSAVSSLVADAFALGVQGFFIKEQSLESIERTLRVIIEYWERCEAP